MRPFDEQWGSDVGEDEIEPPRLQRSSAIGEENLEGQPIDRSVSAGRSRRFRIDVRGEHEVGPALKGCEGQETGAGPKVENTAKALSRGELPNGIEA